MTANLRTLTKEKRELPMKKLLMPATALVALKKMTFAIFCATLLMLVAAPVRADVCQDAGAPAACGVTINITGTPGNNLAATITVVGSAYDGSEDQIVGITNNSNAKIGAIVLSAPSTGESDNLFQFETGDANDGACVFFHLGSCGPTGYEGPNNTFLGISSDFTTGKVLFTTALGTGGGKTWFSLENKPVTVVAIGEAQTLTGNQTSTFKFGTSGHDDYQITPLSALGADTLTITPIPVTYLPNGPFGATNFPNLNCVPYADFNPSGETPLCVEVERDCAGADCATFLYTAQLDFDIDGSQLQSGIGGAAFLGQHGVACPTHGFDLNITTSYTGSQVGGNVIDPLKGGSKGGGSCFVAAYLPGAATVAPGVTVSTFFGFEFPVSDTKVNPVLPPIPVLLNWDLKDTSGNPVTTLHLCNAVNPDGTTCSASKPWVNLSLTNLTTSGNCPAVATGSLPSVPNLLVKGHPPLGLVNLGKGEYSFLWNTATNLKLKGCQVRVVLQFDSGAFQAPAVFQYAY